MDLQSTSTSMGAASQLRPISRPRYFVLDLLDFKLFENRVRTFSNEWKNQFFTPHQMAAAGFFHVSDDKVRCVYCYCMLMNLAEGDDIELKHRALSPSCKFDQKPFGLHLYRNFNNTTSTFQLCKIFIEQEGVGQAVILPEPRYSNFENRLSTVKYWRKNMITNTCIIKICKAGFFYTGHKDNFTCFGCDFVIKIEKQIDEPWFLHSTHRPSCRLLILNKGKHLIEKIGQPLRSDGSIKEVQTPHKFITSLEYKRTNYTFIANYQKELRLDSLTKEPRARFVTIPNLEHQYCIVDPSFVDDLLLCKICRKERMEVVFLPCGHLFVCVDCSISICAECCLCREPIEFSMRLFVYFAYSTNPDKSKEITFSLYQNALVCKMCGDSEMEVALVPCKHVFCCFVCATNLVTCPLCDVKVIAFVRVYVS